MRPNARGWAAVVAAGLAALAGCGESTSPGSLTLAVSPTSRRYGVDQDSLELYADSAAVILAGAGASTTRWTATHGGAGWLSFVTASGSGSGAVRWVVNPIYLPPGDHVDTITVSAAGAAGSPARVLDTLTVRGTAAQFITLRRAWLPGERAATIALWQGNGVLSLPYVGDVSYLADQLLDPDSQTVVVANPRYQAAPAPPAPRAAEFASGWGIMGFQVFQVNRSNSPYDTLAWNGVKWWNPADSTWVGMVVRATRNNTYSLTTVSTAAFDASGGRTGAGGGEAQQSTGTYWEASSGRIQISYNGQCGTTTTVTSGVYQGGTVRRCTVGGRLVSVTMPRLSGTTAPATQTISFDFRSARITGYRFTCIFPSPCTSAPAASVERLRRDGVPLLRAWLTGAVTAVR
jgi:hypothetical protein